MDFATSGYLRVRVLNGGGEAEGEATHVHTHTYIHTGQEGGGGE